jgi:hypothetical protein
VTLPIHAIVRTNVDWNNTTSFQESPGSPKQFIRKAGTREGFLDKWREGVGIDYFQYRGAVRDAAFKTLCETDSLETITKGVFKYEFREDAIIVPIDDDDILFSTVGEIAAHFENPEVGIVCWERLTNYLGKSRLERPRRYLDSCNYAVRTSWLQSVIGIRALEFLSHHWMASELVIAALGLRGLPLFDRIIRGERSLVSVVTREDIPATPYVVDIAEQHSCYFMHSASLMHIIRKDYTVEELSRLPKHPLLLGKGESELRCTH